MDARTLVPDRLRSSYSAKMTAILVVVFLITLVSTVFFYAHVSGELQTSADRNLAAHAGDSANATALWLDAARTSATGVAASGAVESGDATRLTDRLTAATDAERVYAAHYVESGEIQASSQSAATGTGLSVDAPSTGTAVGTPRESVDGETTVVPVVAPAGEGAVVVAASTASLRPHLADSRYASALVVGDGVPVTAGGNATVAATLAGDSGVTTQTVGDGEYAASTAAVPGTEWRVVAYGETGTVYSDQNTATAGLVALLFVVALNLGIFGITIGGNLALALRQLADRASEIGEGNLDVELATDRDDEVGTLYAEFAAMRDSLSASLEEADRAQAEAERAREEAEHRQFQTEQFNERLEAEATRYSETMAACADGDLTRRLDPEIDSAAMQSIAGAFNEMIADLERTVADVQTFADDVAAASGDVEEQASQVREASQEVSDSIEQISTGAQDQTRDLQSAADEVNDLSATVEEVTSTTDQVARESDRVATLGSDGRETAGATIDEMQAIEHQTGEVVDSIEALTEEIEEISEVTRLIDDIAEQTSILALNAQIEAARAGESGDGFSVVANEVKELSEQTQNAVTEIEDRVTSVQTRALDSAEDIRTAEARITDGTAAVEDLTESLESIVDGVEAVNDGLQAINDATDQQARSAQEIVGMVDEVAAVSEETTTQAETVATASREASSSITQVSDAATTLADRTGDLQTMLAEFEIRQRGADPGTDDRVALGDGGE